MPRRTANALEAQLRAIAECPDAEDLARPVLARALACGHGAAVALAATRIRDRAIDGLRAPLEAAFVDLAARGRSGDPGCAGRAAIVHALAETSVPAWTIYEAGLATIQLEPQWGGQADTAGELRARSLLALVHLRPQTPSIASRSASPIPSRWCGSQLPLPPAIPVIRARARSCGSRSTSETRIPRSPPPRWAR